jgi:hypothetical protein
MPARNLPPLEVGQPYRATDFRSFEYHGGGPAGSTATLRLHLLNGTTIDLPATDDELRRLLSMLCDAFGPHAISHLRSRSWI